jgi:diguanylate cyclase (GGDEF)-like protein
MNDSSVDALDEDNDFQPDEQVPVTSPNGATHESVTPTGEHYEPWLFQTMLNELSESELGIGFIYTVLDQLAARYELVDAVVVLAHDSFGTQSFRLGGQTVTPEITDGIGTEPGVYCDPDVVSEVECDAVRTACQLSLSLHLARFSATHDALTNIANRRNFDSALQIASARSARYGWAFTLIIIDLNDFKEVNDRLGHGAGDDLLRQFGFALRRAVRSGDTAARVGGDEFAVILSNAEGHESSGFTERLRSYLSAAGNSVEFTIGTATSPRDSTDPTELKRIADTRLYEKKGVKHR